MPDDSSRRPSSPPRDTGKDEEPIVVGALFLSMVMLVLIAGAWAVMFWTMVDR